ncbi:MAG: TraB/GumN family protein [Thermoplasmata archaeon]|nr:TraB/GumN family protein [Thermoplasmata archaeon]
MAVELTIVGVGHVFNIAEKVRKIIEDKRPDAVAVELDYLRARALLEKEERKKIKNNFLYYMLGRLQERISSKFGVESGDEMLAAMEAAAATGAKIYFIDMNANKVIRKLWKSLSFKRKIQIFASAFLSIFLSKEDVEKEVQHFESNPDLYMDGMEKNFPEFKKILIDERNEHMAHHLRNIMGFEEKIVAVMGEGHVNGIKKILEKDGIKIEIIHLSDLLNL